MWASFMERLKTPRIVRQENMVMSSVDSEPRTTVLARTRNNLSDPTRLVQSPSE
jgi:hypothetical protein